MDKKTEADISAFFEGRPVSFKLFNKLRKFLQKNYQPQIEVTRTQISFGEDYKYLWVWLPQQWTHKRPEDSISVTIVTAERLKSDRIVESVQPKKGYWTHHIILYSEKECDPELEDLIARTYDFYLERKKAAAKKRADKTK